MTEIATFWNNEHPLSEQASKLFDELVESKGHSSTVEGELLRASTKISYDWFNNGWGCNNWSGAVVFLKKFAAKTLPLDFVQLNALNMQLDYVHDYSHGEPAPMNDRRADEAVTKIHEIIVQGILERKGERTPNELDMWDFSEDEYRAPDEDDEEY